MCKDSSIWIFSSSMFTFFGKARFLYSWPADYQVTVKKKIFKNKVKKTKKRSAWDF